MSVPIFLENENMRESFKKIWKSMPPNSQLFLVGGAMRNAVYYHFHKMKLPQRDYDLVFFGDKNLFIQNLRSHKFIYGNIRRKNQTVLKRAIVDNPENFSDFVILDIQFFDNQDMDIREMLRQKINFTINGFGLNVKHIFDNDWINKTVKLPYSIEDIKAKQLRLNTEKSDFFGTDFYACIRFISVGFKKPSEVEVQKLYSHMGKLPKYVFEKNVRKVFDYVGDKENAEKIVKDMGLNVDVFSFEAIQKLRQ